MHVELPPLVSRVDIEVIHGAICLCCGANWCVLCVCSGNKTDLLERVLETDPAVEILHEANTPVCEYIIAGLNLHRHSGMGVGDSLTHYEISDLWQDAPQVTTNVHIVQSPSAAGGLVSASDAMGGSKKCLKALCGAPRPDNVKERGTCAELTAKRLTSKTQRSDKETESIRARSKGFWCTTPRCNRYFATRHGLQSHLRKGECQSGIQMFRKDTSVSVTRIVNRKDHIKRVVHELSSKIVVATRGGSAVPTMYNGTRTDLPGGPYVIEDAPIGAATKRKRIRVCLSPLQEQYLEWCFCVGEKDKSLKIGPRTAASHMTLHGTMAGWRLYSASRFAEHNPQFWADKGAPTFRVSECLEHWYIKRFFSTRKSKGSPDKSESITYKDRLVCKMKVAELRQIATDFGISNGTKKELRERICEHIESTRNIIGKRIKNVVDGIELDGTVVSREVSTEDPGKFLYHVVYEGGRGERLYRDEIHEIGGPFPCFR